MASRRGLINSHSFSKIVNKLRSFFLKRGFIESHTQNRMSILAACEDPSTISTYNYDRYKWPLPQTGQMWLLEHELLQQPKEKGFFCVSTSYRNEPNPVLGRHELIFPIGSAERSCDKDEMRHQFNTISDGQYADILFNQFGKERVEKELDKFLAYDFFLRSGGGIEMTRLMSAMDKNKMDKNDYIYCKSY